MTTSYKHTHNHIYIYTCIQTIHWN